jgi:hypothetical protein
MMLTALFSLTMLRFRGFYPTGALTGSGQTTNNSKVVAKYGGYDQSFTITFHRLEPRET